MTALSEPQRDLLWIVAQHKYGWAHCMNVGGRVRRLQVARALERRGLVAVDISKPHQPICVATGAGREEIRQRWPISPFILGTYDSPPGGWDAREALG